MAVVSVSRGSKWIFPEGRNGVRRRIVMRARKQISSETGPKKKHGEVSFPTQVRYDIVFVIRPLIFILALRTQLQGMCHIP